jgi:hypothetical protein
MLPSTGKPGYVAFTVPFPTDSMPPEAKYKQHPSVVKSTFTCAHSQEDELEELLLGIDGIRPLSANVNPFAERVFLEKDGISRGYFFLFFFFFLNFSPLKL